MVCLEYVWGAPLHLQLETTAGREGYRMVKSVNSNTAAGGGNIAAYTKTSRQVGSGAVSSGERFGGVQDTLDSAAIFSFLAQPPSEGAGMSAQEIREALAEELQMLRAQSEEMRRQMEGARQQGEAKAEALRILRKSLEIAMRIMSGDNVPAADHRFLAENNPELYAKAITMRIAREDPIDYDRLSKDEGELVDAFADIRPVPKPSAAPDSGLFPRWFAARTR